jgi:hypothetical protein
MMAELVTALQTMASQQKQGTDSKALVNSGLDAQSRVRVELKNRLLIMLRS